MHSAEYFRDLFESELGHWIPQGNPPTLYEPIRYACLSGGKRTRPVLFLMTAELFGLNPHEVMPQAVALELFHAFTLVHDDIMDQAVLRRGQQSVHVRYGEATAILAGDAMLVSCLGLLTKCPAAWQSEVLNQFISCALKVCEGQQLDMDFERKNKVSVEEYMQMISLKTAELLGFSAQLAAILAGASPADRSAAYLFGKNLGLAFQLQDDYLDAFGQTRLTGKLSGSDFSRNKKTYLLAKSFEVVSSEEAQQLVRLLNSNSLQPPDVERIKALIIKAGVDRMLLDEIAAYTAEALKHLMLISAPAQKKEELKKLADNLKIRQG
ncbi:MAG: polyprenyl synthetase family protein [Chitinophagales bacterium]|nr:polyprenyl synthetase family protein [Chitinophagales bacterium]MDW8427501.1 polyprenyl synthetase family protein [Chitinophagales bacterium]